VGVVIVGGGSGGGGTADDLVQSLLQSGVDLPQETVAIDDIEGRDDTYVHGPDDHRRDDRHAGGMGHMRSAPEWANLHAGTIR
jgi:hypothetical protein